MYNLANTKLDPQFVGQLVTAENMEYIFQATDPNNPVPGTGLAWQRAFFADVMVTERMYGVIITVETLSGAANWMGWPAVTVSGPYENVFRCLADCWGSNEDEDSMPDFISYLLGDEEAGERWNKGNAPSPTLDPNKIYRVINSPTTFWYVTFTDGVVSEHHSLKRAQQARPELNTTELIDISEYTQFHLPVRLGATGRFACTCGELTCPVNTTSNAGE